MPRHENLNRLAVLKFLDEFIRKTPILGGQGYDFRLAGRPLTESERRRINEWKGRACPTLQGLDNLLTRHEVPLERYFQFCEDYDLDPWEAL